MFGYALGLGLHWPIVAVGMGMFSFAMPPMCSVALTYLTDSYTDASAPFFMAEPSTDISIDHRRCCCRSDVHSKRHLHYLCLRPYPLGYQGWTTERHVDLCTHHCSYSCFYWTVHQAWKAVACKDSTTVSSVLTTTDGHKR